MGTFGPCAAGTIHYERPCPLCSGSCKLPMGFSASPCAVCKSMGGLGTFGPCEVGSVHYKSLCQNCQGKGYSLVSSGMGMGMGMPMGMGVHGVGYSATPSMGYSGGNPAPNYSSYPNQPNQPYNATPYSQPAPTPSMGVNISFGGSGGGFGLSMGGPSSAPPHALVSVSQSRSAPAHAVHGRQNDNFGTISCAVAHTAQGDIPAKAKDGTAWYPYGGKEHTTNNFSWVVVPRGHRLEPSRGAPPQNAVQAGFQNDGAGPLYIAIASTSWGNIPGKAKGNTCWYPYGGQEHSTNNFSWVVHN